MFHKLIQAIKTFTHESITIDGNIVSIYPNPFGADVGLCELRINGRVSNSGRPAALRKLIREWERGERHIKDNLLMVNYDHPARSFSPLTEPANGFACKAIN